MMENNNVYSRMCNAVTAICGNSDDSAFLCSMLEEIKRIYPIFFKGVSCNPLLEETEECYLRKINECIDNFYLVYFPNVKRKAKIVEAKAYKEFLSLLKMINETIETYFAPPTFEPQQIEPTYKVLMEHKTAISDVMGISPDAFTSKLDRWLQKKGAHAKKYSDGLLKLFHNNIDLIEQLIGLSDNDIATKIKTWKNEKDKLGRPFIENPDNGLRAEYARELKANKIIKCSDSYFRRKL